MPTSGKITQGHKLFRTWAAGYEMSWSGGPTKNALDEIRKEMNKRGKFGLRGYRILRTVNGMWYWCHTSRSPTTPRKCYRKALELISHGEVPAESWEKVTRILPRPDLRGWKQPDLS